MITVVIITCYLYEIDLGLLCIYDTLSILSISYLTDYEANILSFSNLAFFTSLK